MKNPNTSTKPVERSVTLAEIATRPLTRTQRNRIAALADLPEDQIDTTDIPEVTSTTGWVRNPLYRPLTQSITIRLNAPDIAVARSLSKKRGLPYQTFIRQLLHEALEREVARHP
jgi:predicted DNA binding CopG/RHH family protein